MKSLFSILFSIPLFACAVDPARNVSAINEFRGSGAGASIGVMQTPRFQRVIYIVFENKGYSATMKQPYFNSLAAQGLSFNQMMAETHPSQGNYIAMVAGDLLGVLNDANVDLNASHLGDLLEKKGMDWRVYAEDFPGNCFLGKTSGKYARKHVPFISFKNVQSNSQRCAKIVDSSGFLSDWSNNRLANFNMFIPNLANDGHDTGVDFAGKWLQSHFGQAFQDPHMMENTLVIVTFDEADMLGANQIFTTLLSPNLPQRKVVADRHNHYSLLKMIEDEWQLGNLGRGDASAPAIRELSR